MFKHVCLAIILLFSTFLFGAGEYDKDIVVKNQTRNDKVKTVFREMMDAYEEEDISQFFSFVSEDRFQQDYMTFFDAIDTDMRVYDILSIDTWVNKIADDGVKRFLYVQWDKRYLATSNDNEINQRGYSRFLFDEVNGKYKLIELAGNNFWGQSLPEWTEEVSDIAGQEVYADSSGNLPDLTPSGLSGSSFDIENIGDKNIIESIEWEVTCSESGGWVIDSGIYSSGLNIGSIVNIGYSGTSCSATTAVIVNKSHTIVESEYGNNTDTL